jgi:hypothetical protein
LLGGAKTTVWFLKQYDAHPLKAIGVVAVRAARMPQI